MKRLIRWLLGILAVLLVLLLAAALILPRLFDTEDLRRTIETRGSAATGRELRIGGPLEVRVFPWIALSVRDLSLANAPGFGDEPFARIGEARVGVALRPLLRKELVVDEIALDGLQLDLQVNADGLSNWADLQDEDGGSGDTPVLEKVAIGGLSLSDARIRYRDATDGTDLLAEALSLDTGALGGGEPFDLVLEGRLEDRAAQQAGLLQLAATVTMDAAMQRFVFDDLELSATLEGGGDAVQLAAPRAEADLGGGSLVIETPAINATLDQGATQASLQATRLEASLDEDRLLAEQLHVEAALDGGKSRAQLDSPRLTADLATERFGFAEPRAVLTFEGQQEPVPVQAAVADLDLSGKGSLALTQYTARFGGADFSGSLTVRDLHGTPVAKGRLSAPAFSPRELLAALGQAVPQTADPGVLRTGRLEADFEGGTAAMALSKMQLVLDDSRFTGAFAMPDLAAGSMRFDLEVDQLDLDRYLPPAQAATPAAGGAPSPLPREELRGWDLEGRLRAGRLNLLGLQLADVVTGVVARDGRWRLEPLDAALFGGHYRGDISLDGSGEALVVDAKQRLEGLGLQALGGTFAGFERMTGTLSGSLATSGNGATGDALLRSLGGDLQLGVTDGVLEGVNIWQEVRKAYAALKRRPAPEPQPDRTPFTKLALNGPIRGGVVELQELAGEVQVLSLTGKGAIHLADGTLDLRVSARVRNAPEVLEDPLVANLVGKRLPLRIHGPVASPSVGVDFADLLKNEAADALLDKLGSKQQRDPDAPVSEKDQLKDAASGLLRDLLQKDRDKEQPPPQEDDDQGGT